MAAGVMVGPAVRPSPRQADGGVTGRKLVVGRGLVDSMFANLQRHVDTVADRLQQLEGLAFSAQPPLSPTYVPVVASRLAFCPVDWWFSAKGQLRNRAGRT